MVKYLKLGGFTLVILIAGFLLGSGSIGDIIQSWISGTGASADEAAIEENRQELADRDVETIGQALGAERPRLNYQSAIRCIVLTKIPLDRAKASGLSEEDILTIRANARALAISQSDGGEAQVLSDLSALAPAPVGVSGFNRDVDRDFPPEPKPSDGEVREKIIELKNTCLPLLGRTANRGDE